MAFAELKERQSRMWGNGPYQNVTDTLADMHGIVIDRLKPRAGVRWLDLACGTGAVAERAARAGAQVTGVDLAPALIATARERAKAAGLGIDYRTGDCENLAGIEDASFDVVTSTCGIMFSPDHAATARELARVTRPGGKLALGNWTAEGGLGQMFKMMAPFMPPPPVGVPSPFSWGDRGHVQELLGDAFELELEDGVSPYRVASGEQYWQVFSTSYGPTKTLAESLEALRREEFHRAWVEFFETSYWADGEVVHTREYLLVLGTRTA